MPAFTSLALGASAIGSVAGGAMSASASRDAADAQAAAADRATALQERMYNQTRSDNEAYRTAGYGALSDMGNQDFKRDFTVNDFKQDPGYDFRMQEGQKALERSAASRGGLQSGGTMKAITQYGQNFASNEYGNAYNRFNADRDRRFGRLSNIAGMGVGAINQTSAAGQNYANNAGNNMMGAANAQGAAGIAQANAWNGTLSGIGKAGMDAYSMNQQNDWMERSLKARGA